MKHKAQLYKGVILLLGVGTLARQTLTWSTAVDPVFLTYLSLTVITSLWRLGVPTAAGTISVGFIFILASLAQLSLGPTLLIGVVGTVIHCARDRKEGLDWVSLSFQTAVVVLGVEAANAAFRQMMMLLPESGLAAALPIAAAILFMVTAFPLAATMAMNEREPLRRIWQNRFLWSLPYYLAGAALAGLLTAVAHMPWWESAFVILPLTFLVYRAYGLQLDSLARERQHAEELAQLQFSMVEALALAVESKNISAIDQLHRMTVFVGGLGRELGLRDDQLKALRAASVLHDIGQVAVPDHILMKPARLTSEEFERLKVHPDIGADIVERACFPYPVAPIIRAHHERWDGSGYPSGLRGEQIPIEARVLSAVDSLVALTSDRHHRRALPLTKAMRVVQAEAGRGLDPNVVEVLNRIYETLDREARQLREKDHGTSGVRPEGETSRASEPPAFLATIAAARREEQSLLEFTQILGSSLNLQETLRALGQRFRRQIPYDTMVLFLMREERLEAVFVEGENYALFNGLGMNVGEGLSGMVVKNRKPALNENGALEPVAGQEEARAARLAAALVVPLDGPDGIVGTLSFYSARRNAFAASHLSLLLAIAPKLATTVENAQRYRKAEDQASFDYLTGLPNAGSLFLHLQNELARCARTNTTLAVLMCDLDGFKLVNDRHGHLTGNKLLQDMSQGLRDHCREYDFVARMGGDEFVVVLPGATPEAVQHRRRRLTEMVEKAGFALCNDHSVSLSMGTAFYPQDGQTAEELLTRADERMYEDKAARKALRAGLAKETAYGWMERSV
jgi:diguanylate cyclase (GGDEF)-like protein